MEEKQTRDISEKELAEMLEAMPDNVVIRVAFGEAKAEKNIQPDRFCALPKPGLSNMEWGTGYGEKE